MRCMLKKGIRKGMVENYNNLAKLSLKSDQTQQAAAYLKKAGTAGGGSSEGAYWTTIVCVLPIEREGRQGRALRTP